MSSATEMVRQVIEFQERVGYRFDNPALLIAAFTHPSFSAEQKTARQDNQRLEFLGDAVLHLIVGELVYNSLPEAPEGQLTKVRSALTNEAAFAGFAKRLGLDRVLLLGKGEEISGGRERISILADAFEAFIGALYLDGALDRAQEICRCLCETALARPGELLATENPKGTLQELTQDKYHAVPDYEVEEVSGPDHEPCFRVSVRLLGRKLADAEAPRRKDAEKRAAALALEAFRNDREITAGLRPQLPA